MDQFKVGELVNIRCDRNDYYFMWQLEAALSKHEIYGKVLCTTRYGARFQLYWKKNDELYYAHGKDFGIAYTMWALEYKYLSPYVKSVINKPLPENIDYDNMISDEMLKELA